MNKHREEVDYQHFREVFKALESGDLGSLGERELCGILQLIRSVSEKGFDGPHQFRGQVIQRFVEALKVRKERTLVDCIANYIEISYLNNLNGVRLVSEHISALFGKHKFDLGQVNMNQAGNLLYAISLRFDLTQHERKIRSFLLEKVVSKIESITLNELIKISTNLNRMDSIDLSFEEQGYLRQIT